jgi:hypothetical protein
VFGDLEYVGKCLPFVDEDQPLRGKVRGLLRDDVLFEGLNGIANRGIVPNGLLLPEGPHAIGALNANYVSAVGFDVRCELDLIKR